MTDTSELEVGVSNPLNIKESWMAIWERRIPDDDWDKAMMALIERSRGPCWGSWWKSQKDGSFTNTSMWSGGPQPTIEALLDAIADRILVSSIGGGLGLYLNGVFFGSRLDLSFVAPSKLNIDTKISTRTHLMEFGLIPSPEGILTAVEKRAKQDDDFRAKAHGGWFYPVRTDLAYDPYKQSVME